MSVRDELAELLWWLAPRAEGVAAWLDEAGRRVAPERVPPDDHGVHRPRRGDDVEAWLERARDAYKRVGPTSWLPLDRLLDRYRECADYGLTLRPEDDGAGDP